MKVLTRYFSKETILDAIFNVNAAQIINANSRQVSAGLFFLIPLFLPT